MAMPEYSERFFRSGTLRIHFREAELVEIPGAGHMVHFDRPRELVTAIRKSLHAEATVAESTVDEST
jgi:pimeloyl-ACP methyl ester carboxylesterase